jgi:hypothetical protein
MQLHPTGLPVVQRQNLRTLSFQLINNFYFQEETLWAEEEEEEKAVNRSFR